MVQEELSFKDISYLVLWRPFCSVEQNHLCNFGEGHFEEQFLRNYFEFGPVVQEKMSLKGFSYLELLQPLCSVEQNHLCKFGRRHHEKQFCEIILNLNQWLRRRLKIFLIWSSGSPFVQGRVTICAILIEGIMRINSVKLFLIWTSD